VSKNVIVRLFMGSIIAVVAGCILGFIAVVAGYGGGAFAMDGPDVVGIQPTPFALAIAALMVVTLVVLVAGAIAGVVAWVGALISTAQLDEKLWFVALLALGVWNLGIVAMVVYVIAGPDGASRQAARPVSAAS
jgi:hypothetical protein